MIILMNDGQILTFKDDVYAKQEDVRWMTIREKPAYYQHEGHKIADIKADQIRVIYYNDEAYIQTLEKQLIRNLKVEDEPAHEI